MEPTSEFGVAAGERTGRSRLSRRKRIAFSLCVSMLSPFLVISNTGVGAQSAEPGPDPCAGEGQGCIELAKAGIFLDENGDGFAQPGETIFYTFTITNTGTASVSNVVVRDPLAALELTGSAIPTLDPGSLDATSFTGSYELTAADISAGGVSNQATAAAQGPDGNSIDDLSDDPSNTTNVDVEGDGEPDDVTDVALVAPNATLAPDVTADNPTGSIVTTDVLANDLAFDVDPTSVQVIDPDTGAPTGVLVVNGEGDWLVSAVTGAITFFPEPGFSGDPTPITYQAADRSGTVADPVEVVVTYAAPQIEEIIEEEPQAEAQDDESQSVESLSVESQDDDSQDDQSQNVESQDDEQAAEGDESEEEAQGGEELLEIIEIQPLDETNESEDADEEESDEVEEAEENVDEEDEAEAADEVEEEPVVEDDEDPVADDVDNESAEETNEVEDEIVVDEVEDETVVEDDEVEEEPLEEIVVIEEEVVEADESADDTANTEVLGAIEEPVAEPAPVTPPAPAVESQAVPAPAPAPAPSVDEVPEPELTVLDLDDGFAPDPVADIPVLAFTGIKEDLTRSALLAVASGVVAYILSSLATPVAPARKED